MKRLSVIELRTALADVLNRAEYTGERTIIHRRGKDAAAIISIEDLRLLDRLRADAEDRQDIADARSALAEMGGRIAYDDFRRRKELVDVQEDQPPTAVQGSRRAAKAAVCD